MFGLPIELISVLAIGLVLTVGTILIKNRKNLSIPSGVEIPSNLPWKKILLGGGALFIFLFWSTVRDWFASWFVETDANQQLNISEDTITNWFWLVIVVGLVLFFLRLRSKEKKEKIFVTESIGGVISHIIVLGVIGVIVLAFTLIALGVADTLAGGRVQLMINNVEDFFRGEETAKARADAHCNFEETLEARNNTLSENWIVVTICKNDDPVLFFVPPGTQPEIEFRDKSDRVLTSRGVDSFVQTEYTYGTAGGMPNLWKLYIPDSTWSSINGFEDANLQAFELEIRARW